MNTNLCTFFWQDFGSRMVRIGVDSRLKLTCHKRAIQTKSNLDPMADNLILSNSRKLSSFWAFPRLQKQSWSWPSNNETRGICSLHWWIVVNHWFEPQKYIESLSEVGYFIRKSCTFDWILWSEWTWTSALFPCFAAHHWVWNTGVMQDSGLKSDRKVNPNPSDLKPFSTKKTW